jgi:hypothetical protein
MNNRKDFQLFLQGIKYFLQKPDEYTEEKRIIATMNDRYAGKISQQNTYKLNSTVY